MTGAPTVADQSARADIATALDQTLVVEAAAGTGKTTALVGRMLAVLAQGRAKIGEMVAVTFTEKAAGELKLRLREALENGRANARLDAPARSRLEDALSHLEEAHIGTIHAFCADLLRERPIEAGIDPLFTVLTETQARRLFDEAFGAWLERALEEMPEGVRRALRRSSRPDATGESQPDGPVDRIRRAGWDLADWRDHEAEWERPGFDRRARIEAVHASVRALAGATARPTSLRDPLYLDTAAARRAAAELDLLGESGDEDGLESLLVDLARDWNFRRARKGSGSVFAHGVQRADVFEAHQALVSALDLFKAEADADLAAALRGDLRGCVAEYEELKAANGALDFLDLLVRARNLVRDDAGARRNFQARFARLFIDEFQDTDPLQAELLMLLAADDPHQHDWTRVRPRPGCLFLVGDPKQSIYRFRRANVGVYQQVVAQVMDRGGRHVKLSTSFRATPDLQRAVNMAFSAAMHEDADTQQAGYIPLAPCRDPLPGQPSLVALPVPRPYGVRRIAKASIEASLPGAVGAFVAWLVRDSGWVVSGRDGAARPVRPGDVCILFRRFVSFGTDVTRPYLDAFEARGIPHVLVGGRAFHDREEIETLRAALAAIEWPDDELSVFAALRGALFAVGDEALLEFRHRFPRNLHPLKVPTDLPEALAPIGDALALLGRLHRSRNRKPAADTVTTLLSETRAHVGFALRRSGEQVLANVLHVAELARQYERNDGLSFRGFVDAMRAAAAEGDAPDAPIVEEGADGVRVMTVHKAKGLEFPVVVLADITAKLAPNEASRWIDTATGRCALRLGGWAPWDLIRHQAEEQARDAAEGVRLAYVAATRARDVLVVPAVGDEPHDGGWVSPLNSALYPPAGARRQAAPADGCPAFGRDSVLDRPDGAPADAGTVCPGGHHLSDGEGAIHDVVWWDPAALGLDAKPPTGIRRQELIAKDVPEALVQEGVDTYRNWAATRAAAIAAAARPSLQVLTTTEWAKRHPESGKSDDAHAVEIVELPRLEPRPGGARFGALVHAVLAAARLEDATGLDSVAHTQARLLGATPDEITAAIRVVETVMRHELWGEARAVAHAGGADAPVWRETAVTLTEGDTLIEGVVDLAYERDGCVVVLDFKTDRADGPVLAGYVRQVSAYARAIGLALGKPTRAILLQV